MSGRTATMTNDRQEDRNRIEVYLDDDPDPIVTHRPPARFQLDTTRLEDGYHELPELSVGGPGPDVKLTRAVLRRALPRTPRHRRCDSRCIASGAATTVDSSGVS